VDFRGQRTLFEAIDQEERTSVEGAEVQRSEKKVSVYYLDPKKKGRRGKTRTEPFTQTLEKTQAPRGLRRNLSKRKIVKRTSLRVPVKEVKYNSIAPDRILEKGEIAREIFQQRTERREGKNSTRRKWIWH